MPDQPDLPPLREVIARHGLSALKSYGQHFLLDLNLTRRIARAAGDLSQGTTIEVGPGPGGLTRALLSEGAYRVVAIERDRRCLAALEELAAAYPGRLETICGDALEIDARQLGEAPRRIVANLPYNVATPLLIRWLTALADSPGCLGRMVLMFQKEVAERLAARPQVLDQRRESVEHPFGSIKQWMGQGAFLMRRLENVRGEFSLTALAYNLRRAINLVGIPALIAAVGA